MLCEDIIWQIVVVRRNDDSLSSPSSAPPHSAFGGDRRHLGQHIHLGNKMTEGVTNHKRKLKLRQMVRPSRQRHYGTIAIELKRMEKRDREIHIQSQHG